jgi:hypothetical protein
MSYHERILQHQSTGHASCPPEVLFAGSPSHKYKISTVASICSTIAPSTVAKMASSNGGLTNGSLTTPEKEAFWWKGNNW